MTFGRAAEDFKSFISANVIGGCDITDEGVLDISYSAGIVFDVANDINQAIIASIVDLTLADDDTNYVYWISGTELLDKVTVPSGNEVLVATIVTASGDISSITPAGIDVANLTNLSSRPYILLSGDDDNAVYTDAKMIITRANLLGFTNSFAVRLEDYRLLLDILVDNNSNGSIGLKDLVAEIDSKNRVNNKDQNREYFYDMSYAWSSIYKEGILSLVVDCERRQSL